ncbi:MAG: RNA 2'-phosphotransferase [Acidobacteriota bacterium]
MESKQLIRISKYLSKHLRHQPARIGLTLKQGGWVEVAVLLQACAQNGFPISQAQLEEVVAHNDKKRFSFDATGMLIRANQGHSIEVDLQLAAATPPDLLYHGSAQSNVESILKIGLRKMARHHVHLSRDIETAIKVGSRHGKPVVFAVDTVAMQQAGYQFWRSDNGVWLVNDVPPQYLRIV